MFNRGRKIDKVRKAIRGVDGVSIHDVFLVHGTGQSPDEKPKYIEVHVPAYRDARTKAQFNAGVEVRDRVALALSKARIRFSYCGSGLFTEND